ncbi:MAG: acyltransferase domain-containing protein [Pseudomonadota bacterium]|nr:acyltransferase domain-containing protein [Pseudomonadota bacterium]
MKKDVAFLYPGQGAQHLGMGFDFYQRYPVARQLFDRADQILGYPLSRICFQGPEEELQRDLNAQLAVYTLSCILTEILKADNIFPARVCGYSSGFYAAAYAADCFDFSYGLYLVKRAGEILLEEGRKINGGMAVIFGLALEKVKDVCRQVGNVDVAIINTPRQIVISGLSSSLSAAMDLALAEGALDVYPLSVAAAYHSSFMKPAGERFSDEISQEHLKDPQIPVMSYLSLERICNKRDLKYIMAAQLSGPVLWVDLIKGISNKGSRLLMEVGPGAVIFRTVKWIDRRVEIMNTGTMERLNTAVKRLKGINA